MQPDLSIARTQLMCLIRYVWRESSDEIWWQWRGVHLHVVRMVLFRNMAVFVWFTACRRIMVTSAGVSKRWDAEPSTIVEIGRYDCVSTGPRVWFSLGPGARPKCCLVISVDPIGEFSPASAPTASWGRPSLGCDPLYQHFYQDQMNKGQNAQASERLLTACAVNNDWSCNMILYKMIQSESKWWYFLNVI